MPDFDPRKLPSPKGLMVPTLDDAVEGWRAWRVARELPRFGNAPKLYSINAGGHYGQDGYYWTPRRAARAECAYDCEKLEVPGESCSCGFYSAKTCEQLLEGLGYASFNPDGDHDEVRVIGQVANWGKVIEGSQGWRASKSYPIQLWVPYSASHLAQPLKDAYGCKVGLKNFVQDPFERSN